MESDSSVDEHTEKSLEETRHLMHAMLDQALAMAINPRYRSCALGL